MSETNTSGSFCTACGTAIPAGNAFCQSCGTRVSEAAVAQSAPAAASEAPPAPEAPTARKRSTVEQLEMELDQADEQERFSIRNSLNWCKNNRRKLLPVLLFLISAISGSGILYRVNPEFAAAFDTFYKRTIEIINSVESLAGDEDEDWGEGWSGGGGNETLLAAAQHTSVYHHSPLRVDDPQTITITNGRRVRLRFTAPAAGNYWFESSHNGSLDPVAYSSPSGTLRVDIIDDDGGTGGNFSFTKRLRAGEVFTFYAGVDRDRGSGSYRVRVRNRR